MDSFQSLPDEVRAFLERLSDENLQKLAALFTGQAEMSQLNLGDANSFQVKILGGIAYIGEQYHVDSTTLEKALEKLFGDRRLPPSEIPRNQPQPIKVDIGQNPYKGLMAFQETDGDHFFGRDPQIKELWEKFRNLNEGDSATRLLAIYGPSGSGKSSLARAGLIPELKKNPLPGKNRPIVEVLVPRSHPLESLATMLLRIAPKNASIPLKETRNLVENLKQTNLEGVYNGLRQIADNMLPEILLNPLVVLVDQLEEVFTLCGDPAERDAFIGNLVCAAADRSHRVSVIVTLRSDFLGSIQKYPKLDQLIEKQGVYVSAMSPEGLRDAISKPAEMAGHPLDLGTVDRLIEQTEGREGALPLLQFALTRIWAGLAEGKEPAQTLRAISGVGGALAGEAQRIYEDLSSEEQEIARRIFLGLVQLGEGSKDTRRRTDLERVVAHRDSLEQVQRVIARFSAPGARLITLAEDGGTETAEVTHEALFDHWKQMKDWLDASRSDLRFQRRLDEAAMVWQQNGRPEGNLWRAPDLDLLRSFYERAGDDMSSLQKEFFHASVKATEKAVKEKKRQRQFLFSVLSTALMFTSGAAIFSIYQWQQAQRQRVEQLAVTSQALIKTNPVMAEVNAIAAIGLADSPFVKFPNYAMSISAHQSLLTAVRLNREKSQFILPREVRAVAFSPDGKQIVSGDLDNNLRRWDINIGIQTGKSFTKHKNSTWSVAISPDGGHKNPIWSVAISPDGKQIISSSRDNTLRRWDVSTGKQIGEPLNGHKGSVFSVAFNRDGTKIVSGSRDKTLQLWDASNGKPIDKPFVGHEDEVWSVAFSPNGQKIVSGSSDHTLRLWDTKKHQKILPTFRGHLDGVNSVAFSPDGQKIVSGSDDKTLRLWDANNGKPLRNPITGKPIAPLVGHEKEVLSVAFSPDGQKIVSGSRDNTLRLWDASNGEQIGQPLTGHVDAVYSVAFSPDGKWIISGGDDKTLRLWDISTEQLSQPWYGHTKAVWSVVFNRDGTKIVSSSSDKTLRLWDASNGKPLRNPITDKPIAPSVGHTTAVYSVVFSPNGKKIVSASGDKTLRLWNASNGKPIGQPIVGHVDAVYSVAFSPDGKKIVSASWDNTLRLWNANNRQQIDKTIGQPLKSGQKKVEDELHSVTFSPNGQQIVSGSRDKKLRLYTSTGQIVGEPLIGHKDEVWSGAFSPDGTKIVSSSSDNTLRLWDSDNGQQIGSEMVGHTKAVYSAVFSLDGKYIVSGGQDKTLRLWDGNTGRPVGPPLIGHESSVRSVAFSPDGKSVISGSDDNTLRLWRIDLVTSWKILLQTACEQLHNHSILMEPKTDVAKEAKRACEYYAWKH
jgi:WD40 repeat protein